MKDDPGRLVRGVLALLTAVIVIGGSSACSSSRERAQEAATEAVRAQAFEARDRLAEILSGVGYREGQDLRDRIRGVLVDHGAAVLDLRLSGGEFRIDAAFTERRQTGGGLTAADVTARLCVRLTGPVRAQTPSITDIPCPANVPVDGNAPNVDVEVRLND